MKNRATRAAMQMGQSAIAGSKLSSREVSAAITMAALVIIYTLVNAPEIFLWALDESLTLISVSSYLVDVIFNAAQFAQVCVQYERVQK